MKRRYWVISPNARNEGDIDYWLEKSRDEGKTFVGYDSDKKHGNTFENTIEINDCVIIAQGARDDRTLYLAGIVQSERFYDKENEIFYRVVNYLIDEKDFAANAIELNSDNAWGESSNPGTIYELKVATPADKIVTEKIEHLFKTKIKMKLLSDLIELLKYKKQIILQGPPGTGKTRMAKEIGIELCRKETITKEDILSVVKKGMKLKSSTDYAIYTVENIANTNISLKLETGTTQSPTYDKIMAAYQQKKWDGGTTGGDAYEAAIAKYVYLNLLPSENYKLIQFHPAYSYEDFVRGITAKSNGTQVEYETVNKALALFAQKAVDNSSTNFVLIIDEINRANLPSVLGELIYALEYRGEKVDSMYDIEGDNSLVLPPNLYIIGTMNTADRSVGHIDYAIKRRFAFVDVPPSDIAIDEVITDADLNRKAKALYANVSKLFNEEKTVDKPTYLQSDFKAKDVQLGHSYFLANTHSELKMKLEFEIKPILFEYVKDGVLSPEAEKEIKALKVNE